MTTEKELVELPLETLPIEAEKAPSPRPTSEAVDEIEAPDSRSSITGDTESRAQNSSPATGNATSNENCAPRISSLSSEIVSSEQTMAEWGG